MTGQPGDPQYLPIYVGVGAAIWLAAFESGVHATIAGVVLGLLTPARSLLPPVDADRIADELSADQHVTAAEVRDISFRIREALPVTERLQDLLHPWTSYLIVPLFVLANAGIAMSKKSLADALTSRVTLGVMIGLVVGKTIGVGGAIFLADRTGIGKLPEGLGPRHILGLATTAGIGFTVSIFITGLAFPAPDHGDEAKLGVLAASAIAAALGALALSPRSNSGSKPHARASGRTTGPRATSAGLESVAHALNTRRTPGRQRPSLATRGTS